MGRPLTVGTSERVHAGHIISGLGHVGVIGWLLFGGAFRSEPPPLEVTEVSVISSAEFEALTAPPSAVTDVVLPEPPAETPTPPETVVPDPVEPSPVPEASEAPAPEVVPETPTPEAEPEIVEDTPEPPAPEQAEAVPVPEVSDRPVPRPSERVAPEAVTPPEPDATPDPVEQAAVTPEEAPAETPPVEEQEQTAQEEAATEITTEAETPSSAPLTSKRPPARRPSPPVATAEAPTPEPDPEPVTDTNAVNTALAEALGGAESQPDAPVGPPLTGGEEQGFLRQVEQCWNIGTLSTEAQRTIVTIAFSLGEDGKPVSASLKMIGATGGTDTSAKQAYETARRAILRCGRNGYDMPAEKYAHWREVELTFNPEKMRLK